MPATDPLAPRATPLIARLPAGILLWAGAAFTVAFVCERFSQVDGSMLALLLATLLWLALVPRVRLRDGCLELFLILACAWQAWMALLQGTLPGALASGWWRVAEHAAGLALCLALAVRRDDPREQLRILGAGAVGALLLAIGVGAYDRLITPLQTICFGYGHLNMLMNTAGPSLLAWLALTIADRRAGRVIPRRDVALLAAGLAMLAVLALVTSRRGVLVAYAAAGAWLLWRRLYARTPPLAIGLAVLAAAAGCVALGRAWNMDMTDGRWERISIYRAAIESAGASFPWGFGYYGALHLQWTGGEHARHLTAAGGWGLHAHNEFLDTLLDGGPLALLLLCALLALLAWRVRAMRDQAVSLAWEAAGIAILVHLATDNCYGTTLGLLWAGVCAGLILGAPTTAFWRWHGVLPQARLLMWPLVLVSMWGVTRTIYPAVLDKDAYPAVKVQCLAQALEPQTVDLLTRTMFASEWGTLGERGQPQVIAMQAAKMGWSGTLAVSQARWAVASGTLGDQLTAFLRILRFTPFDKGSYQQVARIIGERPDLAVQVPKEIARRLVYLTGRRGLPAPDLTIVPADIDSAADLYAAVIWSIATGRPWADLRAPVEHLVHRYGDIPGVALLALQGVAAAPAGTFPVLLDERGTLQFGLRYAQGEACTVLENAAGADDGGAAARALQPLVWSLWNGFIVDCATGAYRHDDDSDPGIRVRVAVVRLWGRLRESGAAPPP